MGSNIDNIAMFAPFKGGAFRVSSAYGPRPSLGDHHNGIDLVGLDGDTAVCAVRGGSVIQSRIVTNRNNKTWEWGNYVAIRQDDGVTAYYCHLDSRAVGIWRRVKAGEVIGVMGNTGYSLGPHLHFEVRNSQGAAFDPAAYLGIPNESGAVIEVPVMPDISYEETVMTECHFEKQTRDYINKYKYAAEFWKRLYEWKYGGGDED